VTGTINLNTGDTSGIAVAQPSGFGPITVTYNSAANSYTISDGTVSRVFSSANSTGMTTSGDDNASFVYFRQLSGAGNADSDDLTILRTGSANPRIQLTYTTYGLWLSGTGPDASRGFAARVFVAGQATPAGAVPTTGSATYTGIVDGYVSAEGTGYRLLGSTGTLTANFATGGINTSLALRGNSDVDTGRLGENETFGTVTGTGSIGAGTNQYTGTLSGLGASGRFNGSFFGPAGSETGYSFSLSGDGNTAAGVFVGKQ
jgi:hypothetical protein